MTAYRGHLTTVVGDGPEVVIKLSGQTVRVLTPDGRIHTWPSGDVRVTGISGDRFWLAFDGEIAVFAPEEPEQFMLEFLPGLESARTVATAIAAATEEPESEPEPIEQSRPGVVQYKPKLPSLAEHVEAARVAAPTMNGNHKEDENTDTGEEAMTPDRRRWWARGQTPPPLRPSEDDTPLVKTEAEDIEVDLTVAEAEHDAPADEGEGAAPRGGGLLRTLASKNREFESTRRGTYKPRR